MKNGLHDHTHDEHPHDEHPHDEHPGDRERTDSQGEWRGRRRGRPGPRRGMRSVSDRASGFRAMHARRWLRDNPAPEEVVAMLTEYQRDLEQEVANVADRIAGLQRIAAATEPEDEISSPRSTTPAD